MTLSRKDFIKTSSVAIVGLAGNDLISEELKVFNSIKFEALHLKGSVLDKFNFAKQAGYNALEVNSQGYNRKEILLASQISGLKIVSVYNSDNWTRNLSSLNTEERVEAVKSVEESILIAKFYNAEYVHLLPGLVDEEKPEESKKSLLCSLRSVSALLAKLKIKALLQNFPSSFFNEPAFLKDVLVSLKSENFGFCLDLESSKSEESLFKWTGLLQNFPSKIDIESTASNCMESIAKSFKKVDCISVSRI